MSQWNVITSKGEYTTLRIGYKKEIFLGPKSTEYKLGNDGRIYTTGGSFASTKSVLEFIKECGLIQ